MLEKQQNIWQIILLLVPVAIVETSLELMIFSYGLTPRNIHLQIEQLHLELSPLFIPSHLHSYSSLHVPAGWLGISRSAINLPPLQRLFSQNCKGILELRRKILYMWDKVEWIKLHVPYIEKNNLKSGIFCQEDNISNTEVILRGETSLNLFYWPSYKKFCCWYWF